MALRAGGPYVADPLQLLRDMRPGVLGLWAGLNDIDPFDGNRDDLNAATIAAAVMCSQGVKHRDGRAFVATDFLNYNELQAVPEALDRKSSSALFAFLKGRTAARKKVK